MNRNVRNYNIRELQLHILKILLAFDNMCKQHQLDYYLVFGTMLGAVRHKGFIPWDDDIDVALPRPQYELFRRHAHEWLPENLEFVCQETDKNYAGGFGKVQDKNTTLIERKHFNYMGGVYIDIFPIDGISANPVMQRLHCIRYKFLDKLLYIAKRDPYKHGKGLNALAVKTAQRLISIEGVSKRLRRLLLHYDYENHSTTCTLIDGMRGVMPKTFYGKPTPIEFEGNMLMGVEQPDSYLSHEFGDYMTIPDEQHRVSHNFYYLDLNSPYRNYKK